MQLVGRLDRLRPAALLIGALALLPACSPASSDPATADARVAGSGAGAGAAQAEQGGHPLLTEALALEPQVRDVIGRLTEECLRDAGVDEFPPQGSAQEARSAVVAPQLSPTRDEATANGYGIHATATSGEPGAEQFVWSSPDDERRFQEVLTGGADGAEVTDDAGQPTIGGCIGQARTAVYGEVAGPPNPTPLISEAAWAAYDADPTVTTAVADWSRCLRDAGHPQLSDPVDAHRYAQYFHQPVGDRPGGPVPDGGPWPVDVARDKEIDLAVVDAGCADESGLRDAQQRAWDAALDAAVGQHGTELADYRDALAAALQRGQQSLAG
ncbi:hypothetical protein O7608_09940 [Solwaraspora sp. WMMA2056]|uniref:hypothetical protein n=1 Tax=Solwaraspora sp. WMMA2056 TaxID=3015161 RepID=UPI00259BB7D2|nr:hypothetical protein [Solwaraspora sp. WMMA2056]WJK42662.1 hypothetical protein O7608_09940 [Solwaraspora sp. WMMA2056]